MSEQGGYGHRPRHGRPDDDEPQYEQEPYGEPRYDQPTFGAAPVDPGPYQPPQYAPPLYTAPPEYTAPEYTEPPPYEAPPAYAPQHGEPTYDPTPAGSAQFGAARAQHRGPSRSRTGGRGKGVVAGVAAAVVAAVVLAILLLAGVFSGSAAGSPRDPVRKLLDAGRTGDVAAARKVLCAHDNKRNVIGILSQTRIKSYQIGRVATHGGSASVTTTVVTTASTHAQVQTLPVVKEGGHWKVCITHIVGGTLVPPPSATDIPTAAPAPLPSSFPTGGASVQTGGINACAYATSPADAAQIYVAAAELGQTPLAQSCVRKGTVPQSLTASLKASSTDAFYDTTPTVTGQVAVFKTLDGSGRLAVTVAKSGTGYVITDVVKS